MILSARELELGDDHTGILLLDGEPEPGTPLADVLPISEQVLDVDRDDEPRRPALRLRPRARGGGAHGGELRPMPGTGPVGDASGVGRRLDRGQGRLPALHRPDLPRRRRRRLAGVAARPARGGRDARDLERRRRDELRDARVREPAARVRSRDAAGGKIVVRAATDGEELRTLDGELRRARPARPRDRRRRAGGRARGPDGRPRDRGGPRRRPRCCSRRRTSSRSGS